MTTIRQFIQTSPAKALGLFDRLVETSDTAIKTRERLFGQLKEELELFASLEEQHLFPVLKKHKEMKELVQEALSDNKQTRKLLTELEHTAKDDEGFIGKVIELRKSFQQHVRDEKKELLPAVLKALTDEEAESVLANIEHEKAQVEAAKRAEADERREEARQEREQAESVQRTANGIASTVRSVAKGAQRAAETAQDGVRSRMATATEAAQRSTDHVVQLFSLSGKQTQDTAVKVVDRMQVAAHSSTVLFHGFQEVSREWFAMTQKRTQMNVEALTGLAQCRSLPELLAAQAALLRDNPEMTLENSRRLSELSVGVIEETTRTASKPKSEPAGRAA